MAQHLYKATEQLIEAAVGEVTAQSLAASKDTLAELKHIHSIADTAAKSVAGKLDALVQTASKQTRTLAIQGALGLLEKVPFDYMTVPNNSYGGARSADSSTSVSFRRSVLTNALRGLTSILSNEYVCGDGNSSNRAQQQELFRTNLKNHLHGLTGIEPQLTVCEDKSYTIHL